MEKPSGLSKSELVKFYDMAVASQRDIIKTASETLRQAEAEMGIIRKHFIEDCERNGGHEDNGGFMYGMCKHCGELLG